LLERRPAQEGALHEVVTENLIGFTSRRTPRSTAPTLGDQGDCQRQYHQSNERLRRQIQPHVLSCERQASGTSSFRSFETKTERRPASASTAICTNWMLHALPAPFLSANQVFLDLLVSSEEAVKDADKYIVVLPPKIHLHDVDPHFSKCASVPTQWYMEHTSRGMGKRDSRFFVCFLAAATAANRNENIEILCADSSALFRISSASSTFRAFASANYVHDAT